MLSPQLAALGMANKLYHRFHKAMESQGIFELDGIEVYPPRFFYYHGGIWLIDDVKTAYFKAMGVSWADLYGGGVDGDIRSMWFSFRYGYQWDGTCANSTKTYPSATTPRDISSQDFVDHMNDTFEVDDEIEVTVAYGGDLQRYVKAHSLPYTYDTSGVHSGGLDTEAIRDTLDKDTWYHYGNCRHISYTKDNYDFGEYDGSNEYGFTGLQLPSKTTVNTADVSIYQEGREKESTESSHFVSGLFALMDDDDVWEVVDECYNEKITTRSTGKTSSAYLMNDNDELVSTGDLDYVTGRGEALQYTFTRKFKYKGANDNSKIAVDMAEWCSQYEPMSIDVDTKITSRIDTKFKKYIAWVWFNNETDNLWYKGHLRVDRVKQMKRRDFVEFFSQSIYSDYDVEKASSWERIVAVAIVVIAAIVGYLVGGPLGAGKAGEFAIGWALASAGLTLSLGGALLAKYGGMSAGGLVETIGKFAQIVNYASMMVGLSALWNGAKDALIKEMIAEEVAKGVSVEVAKEAINVSVVDVAIKVITDAFVPAIVQGAEVTFNTVVNFAQMSLKLFQQVETYKSKEEMEDLQAETAILDKEIEDSKTNESVTTVEALWALHDLEMFSGNDAITQTDNLKAKNYGTTPTVAVWKADRELDNYLM